METSCVYMPSVTLAVAPTAFVVLAKENIEKRSLYIKSLFFEYTKGDHDGIHTKEAKETYRRFYTMLLKVSDALRYVVGTLDCITTWSRFVHHFLYVYIDSGLGVYRRMGVGTGGGKGPLAPQLSREGSGRRSGPPHTFGRPHISRPLFFHPHNSTVLTPNQSARYFEKFIGVGTRGARDPATPPVFLQCVCGGGVAPHAGSPFGPVFQCPAI